MQTTILKQQQNNFKKQKKKSRFLKVGVTQTGGSWFWQLRAAPHSRCPPATPGGGADNPKPTEGGQAWCRGAPLQTPAAPEQGACSTRGPDARSWRSLKEQATWTGWLWPQRPPGYPTPPTQSPFTLLFNCIGHRRRGCPLPAAWPGVAWIPEGTTRWGLMAVR